MLAAVALPCATSAFKSSYIKTDYIFRLICMSTDRISVAFFFWGNLFVHIQTCTLGCENVVHPLIFVNINVFTHQINKVDIKILLNGALR